MTDSKVRNTHIRNIGIIAHVDAGKTTLTERILYFTGKSHLMGDVDKGNTVTDSSPQEREKGITISSAAVSVNWQGQRINIIDTPGHIDFNIEVNRSLRVLDGAVVVFDAVAGVEPQTETNWRLADKYGVPRVCLINKMDRVGAEYFNAVESIKRQLQAPALMVQIPIGCADTYQGLIDLVSMKALVWPEGETRFVETGIPAEFNAMAQEYREIMLFELAEHDSQLADVVLAGESVSEQQLHQIIRKLTLESKVVPIACASAYKNKGVEPLLDMVVRYLPAPKDMPAMVVTTDTGQETEITPDVNGPFSALAFKVTCDKHGALTYLRVYSGELKSGDKVYNSVKEKTERIGRVYVMHADKREAVESLKAGDIVAVQGLKHTQTGDTLCDKAANVILEKIAVPEPVIDIAVEAKTGQDQTRLADAINVIASEDPSLKVSTATSGEILLSGMGELHLEVVISRLAGEFDLPVKVGKPQVAYRETLKGEIETGYSHKKQSGGPGQYAKVTIRFEPIDGQEIEFDSEIVGAAVPKEYIPAVEAGIREAAEAGVLAGFPLGGFRATLVDGETHAQDSSQVAFKIAAAEAFVIASKTAGVQLLEPLMAVEIVTPQACLGDVIGDLARRRGQVNEQEFRGDNVVVYGNAPLSEMFGYIGDLRSLSAGRASFSMSFERYTQVPGEIARTIA